MVSFDFSGKNVVVTGASRGIGRAVAIKMAEAGARVLVHFQKNKKAAAETLRLMSQPKRGSHFALRADLADPAAIREMVDEIDKEFEKVDILVNNAGIFEPQAIDMNFDDWADAWQNTINVNLMGAVHLTYHIARRMVKSGGGKIVNVSSRGAFRGEPDHPAYGASKAALNAFGQSMAVKLAPDNVQVFTLAPGFVETDMAEDFLKGDTGEAILKQYPGGKVASPEEVANAVCYFASQGQEMASGAILDLNGASYLRS
ncbi:MAG: SDR family oxidoreductase [Saprospiraceae bacterium]|nr:SDR family oxidoreductase [Saprospiraceae bacterium]